MAANLDPALLKLLLGGGQQDGFYYNPVRTSGEQSLEQIGNETPTYGAGSISKSAGGGLLDSWNPEGGYMGRQKDARLTNAQIAAIAALTFAGGAGLGGAIGAGAGAGGGLTGLDAAMADLAASGSPAIGSEAAGASLLGGPGDSAAYEAGLQGGSDAGLSGLGSNSDWLNAALQNGGFDSQLGANAGSFVGAASPLTSNLGNVAQTVAPLAQQFGNTASNNSGFDANGKTLAQLAGAAAGAASAKDQTQTTSREPWAAAQPLLKDILGQAGTQFADKMANPFTPTQQTAYGNQFGLLNAINQAVPGLLTGVGANASGANAYDRANPRRSLVGANPSFNWTPGLLSLLGGK